VTERALRWRRTDEADILEQTGGGSVIVGDPHEREVNAVRGEPPSCLPRGVAIRTC